MENVESASTSASPKKGSGNRNLIILAIFLLVIVLGFGGFFVFGKKTAPKNSSQVAAQKEPSPTSANVFTSIQDALTGSMSIQCDFTDQDGRQIVSYIKEGRVRTDIAAKNAKESGSFLMKDKKMYFWNGTQGTIMEFDLAAMSEKITPVEKKGTASSTQQNPQNIVSNIEKYKESCKTTTVSESLFTPPSDVKFTDLSAITNPAAKASPSALPGGITEEQIKALQ